MGGGGGGADWILILTVLYLEYIYSLVKYTFSKKNGWSLQANNASENTIGEQTPNQSGLA